MSKGLEALKKIEKEMSRLCGMDIAYDGKVFNLFHIVGKELQALEIIKKYHITAAFFTFNNTYKTYEVNMSFYEDEELMSEEEYNLAKEVLL